MRKIRSSACIAALLASAAAATLAAPAAWAQHGVPPTTPTASKQTLKLPKTDVKSQQTAKPTRPAPQSLRYLMSDSP